MAMELFVLSDRRLSSIAEWQQAIDAEGFALRLSDETSFDALNGVLPVQLDGKQTGFECVHWNAGELMREASDIDFGQEWKYALSFRWLGSRLDEGDAALMAAAAYARATGGVVLDWDNDRLLGPDQVKEIVRESLQSRPAVEEAVRRVIESLKPQS